MNRCFERLFHHCHHMVTCHDVISMLTHCATICPPPQRHPGPLNSHSEEHRIFTRNFGHNIFTLIFHGS